MKIRQIVAVAATSLTAAATLGALAAAPAAAGAAASTTTYYVDCTAGSDTDSGRSTSAAWKTISRANAAALLPGDALRLKRDCTWDGDRLDASWNGTADSPVVIGTYGHGARPVIRNGKNQGIKVTGSHQEIKGLEVDFDPQSTVVVPAQPAACVQPVGNYYGVNFTGGAHDNVLRNSLIRHATAGVHLSRNSHANHVLDNEIFENNVAKTWTQNPGRDLGAWGILVVSDDNEIAGNTLRNNAANCRNGNFQRMSNSVEIFEGSDNWIHHNRAEGDRVFSELGSSNTIAESNVFAYNVHITAEPFARFVTTRGAQDTFGPVRSTQIIHNTVVLTGPDTDAVVCGGGCGSSILTVHDNILWAERKGIYADGDIDEGNNVYWSSAGDPMIQMPAKTSKTPGSRAATSDTIDRSSSVIADPLFRNLGTGDVRVKWNSPTIERGDRHPIFDAGVDIDGKVLPAEITTTGAHERS